MKYQIKNWTKFQHYKDRNPPWIKLHESVLASADWVMLDNDGRVLAIASMLVAAKNDNQIDTSEAGRAYMQRVAYLPSLPDFKPLINCGFLVPCDPEMLADASTCKRMLADARPEQRRAETEQSKTEKKTGKTVKRFVPPTLDQVQQYCRERGRGVDAERFVDFYQAKGWMVGSNKMKDWKAAVRTWEKSQPEIKRARTELR
jgi:hypothetical protein